MSLDSVLNAQIDEKSDQKGVYCSYCKTNFANIGARFNHYQSCEALKAIDKRIAAQYKSFAETAKDHEKALI